MKRTCTFKILSIILFFIAGTLQAQESLTIQPDADCGKDALIGDCQPCGYYNTNFGSSPEMNALAWTNGGNNSNHRSLLQFDFSKIPSGSTITNAQLYLYYNPTSGNATGQHSNLTGPNDAVIERIISSWDENTVTWANQPMTDTAHHAVIPASTSGTQNFVVDVTSLVQDMIDNGNFGMLLKLADETKFRCLLFASSDHPDPALHPKIVISYAAAPVSCYDLQLTGCDVEDALIGDCVPCNYYNQNFGDSPEMNALAWTNGGNISNHRSLIKWDLSSIPSSALISQATLTLFYNPTSGNAGGTHSTLTGPNDAWLERITGTWSENTVTWANQPATDTVNRVYLPPSISVTQDYVLNVTGLIQDMVASPASNNGLMLKLNTEINFRCLLFASSDHPIDSIRPRLEICYDLNSGVAGIKHEPSINIYPNPSAGKFKIYCKDFSGELFVTNIMGETVYSGKMNSSEIPVSINVHQGEYFVTLIDGNSVIKKKISVIN